MPPADSLRVVLVLATSTGGIGAHVRSLASGLLEAGHDVTVCGPVATQETFGFGAIGARFVEAPVASRGPGDLLAVRRILREESNRSDLVHAHGLRATATAALAGCCPLVSTWHNAPLSRGPTRAAHVVLEAVAARRAGLTLAASDDLAERARRAGARRARFVPVVAAPLPPPSRPAGEVRRELGVGQAPLVLSVARLHRQKRIAALVEAARGWADLPGAPVLVVAGDGPQREDLTALAARVHAPLHLLGRREDIADLLAAADVVVLASAWEARPLVAQEALRAGVPLVATAVGGLPGLVGAAADLVPADDVPALRRAILRVIEDPARAAALRARGPVQAAGWPSQEEALTAVVAAYREVLERYPTGNR